MIVFASPRFTEHTPPPSHPERLERGELFEAVAAAFARRGGTVRAPRLATDEELLRIHTSAHVATIEETRGRAAMLDADTFTSPESAEVARLAAGAAIDAARHAWDAGGATLALVRPPGHHAEPDRPMGFCLYNNIAVAAAALRAAGVERVAIVDIDVHHGNGTQAAFDADPAVLYVSSHQFPFYPGTGAAEETGSGAGRGFTVNIPLEAGATDAIYAQAYETRVLPALEGFRPQIILVSAGFDAHVLDPLARMRMSTAGYLAIVAMLRDAAARLSAGRSAWITEGGYHLGALEECLQGTLEALG
jgi:acetoin utilization deacetylase AcuC-like enzyme